MGQDDGPGPGSLIEDLKQILHRGNIFPVQRRYDIPENPKDHKPKHGAILPDQNIDIRLKVIRDSYAPVMAKAVLLYLKQKVDANPQILKRDKDYFVAQTKKIVGIDI